MGWFKKDEEDFDDSAAFESDKYATLKVILMIVFGVGVVVLIGWMGYTQIQKFYNYNNETNGTISNITTVENKSVTEGKIEVNFTDFNLTVDKNPTGMYYYTTQEKVTGERCYIDDKKENCERLTENTCKIKKCEKELITETECFVNSKKIKCPN